MLVHEVVAANSSPVEVLWKLRVWDLVGIGVLIHIFLGLVKGSLEIGTLSKLILNCA